MTWELVFLVFKICFYGAAGAVLLACLYLLYRNEKIYQFRISVIESDNWERYDSLPTWNFMLYTKWYVWPVSKTEKEGAA